MKYSYSVTADTAGKKYDEYVYRFGNTSNVALSISSKGFSIRAELGRLYTVSELLASDSYLFSDAVKKALLIYLLKFSKSLDVKSVTIRVGDSEETIDFVADDAPLVFSMIKGELKRAVPKEFSNETIILRLLNTPKSKYDDLTAALFALLCSKKMVFETERFVYLWMALNGMYNYYCNTIDMIKRLKSSEVDDSKKHRKEEQKILCLQRLLKVGNERIKNDSEKTAVANIVEFILQEYSPDDINRDFIEKSELNKRIRGALKKKDGGQYNLTAYGYILTQLSYYYRCKIIHGNRPIILFAYPDDKELHALRIVNKLLEDFIDETLPNWLDENYYNSIIVPAAQME